jgi:hypothetical protein
MRSGLPIGLGRDRRGYFECAFTSAQSRPRLVLSIFPLDKSETNAPPKAFVFSGRQAVFSSVNSRPTQRSRRALTSAESWPCPASSGFLFGQLETDATLQACAYFGQIMALPRFERFSLRSTQDRRNAPGVRLLRPNHGPSPLQAVFSSINSRPTQRSRRALTSAESWPFPASSGFLFGDDDKWQAWCACP